MTSGALATLSCRFTSTIRSSFLSILCSAGWSTHRKNRPSTVDPVPIPRTGT
jgi:hypothetical protein